MEEGLGCVWMGNKSKVCVCVLQSKLTWGPYFWFHMWRAATSTISGVSTLNSYTAHHSSTADVQLKVSPLGCIKS